MVHWRHILSSGFPFRRVSLARNVWLAWFGLTAIALVAALPDVGDPCDDAIPGSIDHGSRSTHQGRVQVGQLGRGVLAVVRPALTGGSPRPRPAP